MSAYLLVMFGGLGVHFNYLQIFLRDQGFSYQEIGFLQALIPMVAMFSAPAWGAVSDSSRDPRKVLGLLLMLAPATHLLLLGGGGFISCLAVCLCIALFYQPVLPIQDSLILRALHRYGGDYGHIRIWGSLGFTIPALMLPFLWIDGPEVEIDWTAPGLLFAGYSILTLLLLSTFPPVPPERHHRLNFGAFRLLRNRTFSILLVCAFLARIASSALDGYQAVYFEEMGVPIARIGLFLVLGPLSEVATIFYSQRWLVRWGAKKIMALCLAALVVRLVVTATASEWAILAGIQVLHCLTFGTQHVVTTLVVNQLAGDRIRSSAQTLTAVLTNQSARLLGLSASGVLAGWLGIPVLLGISSGIAALSLILWLAYYHDTPDTILKDGMR